MKTGKFGAIVVGGGFTLAIVIAGCRDSMPHASTWPAGGDIQQTHAKPPEGGYYTNWDPYSATLEVTPLEDLNPVRTQHVLVATVRDEDGEPLPNRRVEWLVSQGSVGDIVEVDESGWRASRGYKVDNRYAVSHTNNGPHVLDLGNDDPSDDIYLEKGQTWCVITSPVEGDTHMTVYAPGIYDWSKHKIFVVKHWYDIAWTIPEPATNPIGSEHQFVTHVMKHSDGTPLADYVVTYSILDGPDATFEPGGGQTATVVTDENGDATVILRQTQPAEGVNNIEIDIVRPENVQCCKPAAHIATEQTSKTWVGPRIAITKDAPAQALVNETFTYNIVVSNPAQVSATNAVVTDTLPNGIAYVSSTPAADVSGQSLRWSLGEIAGGASREITVQVKGTRTGTFENCANVAADYGLEGRDCATTVIMAPSLALEKTCTAEVTVCEQIEYTITVRNTGDGPATNVEVRELLPEGITTDGGQQAVAGRLPSLAPGEAKQFQFLAQAERAGTYENTVTATADGGLTAEASCTTVVLQPQLEVTKTGPELRYIRRDAVYEVTVTNSGDIATRDTILVDELPAGTEFVSASNDGQFEDGKVTWQLGTLQPGASVKTTVTVKPIRAGVVRNTVMARAFCAEASAQVTTEVKGIPAVLLEMIDVEDPDEVGTTDTYIITVTNQGSADATNVRITCEVQPEAEFVSATAGVGHQVDGRTVMFEPVPAIPPLGKTVFQVTVRGIKEGDTRFRVKLTSDQTTSPVEETESTRFYE